MFVQLAEENHIIKNAEVYYDIVYFCSSVISHIEGSPSDLCCLHRIITMILRALQVTGGTDGGPDLPRRI